MRGQERMEGGREMSSEGAREDGRRVGDEQRGGKRGSKEGGR